MITAFTSSLSNNIQMSPQDKELAQSALTTSVQVFAEAVDTENAGATFTFSWTLLDGPSGHNATFADDTVQNRILTCGVIIDSFVLLQIQVHQVQVKQTLLLLQTRLL